MFKKEKQTQQVIPRMRDDLLVSLSPIPSKDLTREELEHHYELLMQRYRKLANDYLLLANSKAGKFTLFYWRTKDWLKARITTYAKQRCLAKKMRKPLSNVSALPTVSIIIPTYKETPFLDRAVHSVLMQDYPQEKIEILIAVNGPNRAYFETVTRRYQTNTRIKVLYTEKQNASAARNLALAAANTECVCYLDDDDRFTKGYLRSMAVHMYPDVTIVCAPLCDYHSDTGEHSKNTYVNRALSAVGAGIHKDYFPLASLFSSLPGKLFRTELLKMEFSPLDESVRSAEDVLFWASNYHNLRGCVYLCKSDQDEHYIRQLTVGSLSRPSSHEWRRYVMDRLDIIKRLEAMLNTASPTKEGLFIRSKIDAQKNLLYQYIAVLSADQRSEAEALVQTTLLDGRTKI